jgi:dihydrofolate synthase/folylpolyglutamate synthase
VRNPPSPGREGPELRRWLDHIEGLHSAPVELGLERLQPVAGSLGLLPSPLPLITVAGTNGKGSVAALLEEALRAAGHCPGLFTSPHFFRFNERVRVAGAPVADRDLSQAFAAVEEARRQVPLTYFEMATLAALEIFHERCNVAVLEVGLGGRLDAVNLWDPSVAVVTSVGLDHAAFLGEGREAIGAEKAGIFRAGVPAVCGDPDPPESVLGREGEGVPLWRYGRDFVDRESPGGWCWVGPGREIGPLPEQAMPGAHQRRNAATALAAASRLPAHLQPEPAAWQAALATVVVPGRCQVVTDPGQGTEVWLDVAHNPQAAEELGRALAGHPVAGENLAVLGGRADKDLGAVVEAVAPYIARWYPCGINDPQGLSPDQVAEWVRRAGKQPEAASVDPQAAWRLARARAGPGDRVVALGSFRVVEAVWEAVGQG